MALTWPVTATISQQFGTNPNSIQPNGHTGMDFAVAVGTSVKAAGAGTVVWADWATKLSASNQWWVAPAYAGICVIIDHGNGLLSLYAHLNSTGLNIGSRVSQGQEIGKSGNTGLSTGPHLHFEILGWPLQPYNNYYGRLNPNNYVTATPTPVKLLANQRKVGAANVNMRAAANTTSKILRIIPANSVETFTGYYNGERVNGNNLWYRDAQGFAHSAGFTTVSATGLPNTTPPPPVVVTPANQRTVGKDNVNLRAQANTSSAVIRVIPANTKEVFTGYVKGETVAGNNIWYKDAKGYAWSGGFTSQAVTGLTDQTPKPEPVPTPTPTPVPTPPVVTVATKKIVPEGVRLRNLPSTTSDVKSVLAGDSIAVIDGYVEAQDVAGSKVWFTTGGGYAHSSGFVDATIGNLPKKVTPNIPAPPVETAYSFTPDFSFVEYKPADTANMQDGNFPALPAKLVLHQFDAKENNPKLDGVVAHFQTPRPNAPSSAHFGVSGNRIVQFVSLKDRAFHAGTVGNDYIGIEIDPQEDAATVASVKKLIAALNAKYNKKFEYTKHRDVPGNSTLCGADIHLEKYLVDITKPDVVAPEPEPKPPVVVTPIPVPVPTPEPEPVPTPAPDAPKAEEQVIDEFLVFIKEAYFRNKQ